MVTVEAIEKELEKVVDPEIGLPITEMHLVDEINIQENGEVSIKYHLTAPFCPPIFAEDIGMNIRTLTSKLEGVKKVTVVLHGHALSNEINLRVNPGYTIPPVPPAASAQTKV
ncbi:MAG TPA: iron-sulfur cluster assembly protein [Candidatus Sulfotelmatobacter sp.]|jgi:metal-sulfur cluster biosynthetic enzyme|nr:iron-sulfur cluster assembly protein [Candidatus Sulfotelmatobacter sp.]